jgi:hypothetical protein
LYVTDFKKIFYQPEFDSSKRNKGLNLKLDNEAMALHLLHYFL